MLNDRVKTIFETNLERCMAKYSGQSMYLQKYKFKSGLKWALWLRTFDSSQGPDYDCLCILTLEEAKELYKHPLVSVWSDYEDELNG